MHAAQRLFLCAGLLLLSACTSYLRSDVATFHKLPLSQGETIAIQPLDPTRADSLEFARYAEDIAPFLTLQGYRVVEDTDADLIAGFDVGVSQGREKTYGFVGAASPFWVGYGGFGPWGYPWGWGGFGRFGRFGPWWDPWWGGGAWGPGFGAYGTGRPRVYTVYTSELSLEIRRNNGEKLYEGRAQAETRSNALTTMVPLLAESLFQDFPGTDGETQRVKIELEKPIRPPKERKKDDA